LLPTASERVVALRTSVGRRPFSACRGIVGDRTERVDATIMPPAPANRRIGNLDANEPAAVGD